MTAGSKNALARQAYATAYDALLKAGFADAEARMDALDLLAYIKGVSGLDLLLGLGELLSDSEAALYSEVVKRRLGHEPMAYITGWQDFGGFDLRLTPGVLIPRRDTLTLVEQALARLSEDKPYRVLELGCGSGAVILSVAKARPLVWGMAIDIDPLAIESSRQNFDLYGVSDRIELRQASWDEGFCREDSFDMILSNPPYLSTEEMLGLDAAVMHEPEQALWGGEDGLDCYRRILPLSRRLLRAGGLCLVEIGWKQGQAVMDIYKASGYHDVAIVQDEGLRDRVVCGYFPGNIPCIR